MLLIQILLGEGITTIQHYEGLFCPNPLARCIPKRYQLTALRFAVYASRLDLGPAYSLRCQMAIRESYGMELGQMMLMPNMSKQENPEKNSNCNFARHKYYYEFFSEKSQPDWDLNPERLRDRLMI